MYLNPYTTGSTVTKKDFYDRNQILSELSMFDGKAYFLNGVRRVGKSSILRQLEYQLNSQKEYVALYLSLEGISRSSSDIAMEFCRVAGNALKNAAFAQEFTFEEEGFEDALIAWIRFCKDNDISSFLLIDEIEHIHSLPVLTISSLVRSISNDSDCIKVIVAGTRQFRLLNTNIEEYVSFTGLFSPKTIGHISFRDAQKLICQEQSKAPIALSEDYINHIYQHCGGHPYLIQYVCDKLFIPSTGELNKNNRSITTDDQLNNCFTIDFNGLGAEHQKILVVLAVYGESTIFEIVQDTGDSRDVVENAVNELIEFSIVYVNENQEIYIGYSLFSDWIRKTYAKLGSHKTLHISYAPEDTDIKNTFLRHLNLLAVPGQITIWHDGNIPPGVEVNRFVSRKMKSTDVFIFLISTNLLSFARANELEIPLAWQHKQNNGQCIIIPILLRDTLLDQTVFNDVQLLLDGGQPILLNPNPENVWPSITKKIKKIISG